MNKRPVLTARLAELADQCRGSFPRERGRLAESMDTLTAMFPRRPGAPPPRIKRKGRSYVLIDPEGERVARLIAEHVRPYQPGDIQHWPKG